MARLLFTVEDIWIVRGRGIGPLPGIIPQGDEKFQRGDRLQLRRPDGSTLMTTIAGWDMFNRGPNGEVFILLEKSITKDQVPIGTEVWSVDESVSDVP
jgi:hypothetical protein